MNRPPGSDDGWSSPNQGDWSHGDWSHGDWSHGDWSAPTHGGAGTYSAANTRVGTGRPAEADDWSAAGPVSARDQRATRLAERRTQQDSRRAERSVQRLEQQVAPRPHERGTNWWLALAVLVGVTLLGALIDSLTSSDNQNGFNIAIVVASVAAILLVKRSQMFPIVVSPPIVYSLAALLQLYLRNSLSQDKHGAIDTILNAVQNYLVYGFPALATATAAVLIIAGIRLVARR